MSVMKKNKKENYLYLALKDGFEKLIKGAKDGTLVTVKYLTKAEEDKKKRKD